MNILILGGGAREHALAWAFAQNPRCDKLIVAPGNPGLDGVAECALLDILDGPAIATFADTQAIDLVVIGPEAPLVAGVADDLRGAGLAVLGPSAAAARIEGSKSFAKAVCEAAGVPTAAWAVFDDADAARRHIRDCGAPIVVKADGLAAGKGVLVATTEAAAVAAVDDIFAKGPARAVLEDVLLGEEASLFVLTDGTTVRPFGTAQDHKRLRDGDEGPNTGGMGAISPAPILTAEVEARAMAEIVHPTLRELARLGAPFQGVLYVGLMIEESRPSVVEFNARLGDPEAQALMLRLGGQALDLIAACAEERLGDVALNWADDHAMAVVLAAENYPAAPVTGTPLGITDIDPGPGAVLFQAGTSLHNGQLVTAGGRVLTAAARGAELAAARDRAYALTDRAVFPGAQYRRDIGHHALKKPDC